MQFWPSFDPRWPTVVRVAIFCQMGMIWMLMARESGGITQRSFGWSVQLQPGCQHVEEKLRETATHGGYDGLTAASHPRCASMRERPVPDLMSNGSRLKILAHRP